MLTLSIFGILKCHFEIPIFCGIVFLNIVLITNLFFYILESQIYRKSTIIYRKPTLKSCLQYKNSLYGTVAQFPTLSKY